MADTSIASGPVPYFASLLGEYNTSIPIQSQWVLAFDDIPETFINLVQTYERYTSDVWKIGAFVGVLSDDPYQKQLGGCIFAQDVKMPPDGITTERVGDFNGGYVRGLISTNRTDFGTLDASFLETNLSFADLILRPWSIVNAHRSFIARDTKSTNGSLLTNITVYHLGKAGPNNPMVIRKTVKFWGCAPVSVDAENYSYTGEKIQQRQVSFAYKYYTLDGNIANGKLNYPTTPVRPDISNAF